MGMMDMLNPVNAVRKVGQQVQKLPGVGQLNKVASGAANAAQKFAPPGMKGIGPSFPSPAGPPMMPPGMSKLPMTGQVGGMMGKMFPQQMPNMGPMNQGQPIPQMPVQEDMPITPMPDVPVGPMDPSAGMQQWMQRMKTKNTGINGGRGPRGPLVQG
jgi:hypothetical protein